MDSRDRYLAEVAAHLTLPEELKADILEELAAHLGDSVDGLRNAGREPQMAEAEAIARLGPPMNLAQALMAARRTPTQLLAAAGAGTWAALRSGVAGALAGWFLVFLSAIFASIVVVNVAHALGTYVTGWTGPWNTVLTALVLDVGAFAAGAAAVPAVARSAWRAPSEVRGAVALIGGTMLAFLALVLFEAELNWASVIALVAVPVAFALGARTGTVPRLGARRVSVVVIATVTIVFASYVATSVTGGNPREFSWNEDTHGAGILPEWWGGSSERSSALFDSSQSTRIGGTESVAYHAVSQQVIAQFTAFRLEAWAAQPPRDEWRLVPGQSRPYAVAPAYVDGAEISGTIAFNTAPTVEWAEVVLTAVGPDGQRYLMAVSGPEQTEFFGSVWSWFTALAR